LVVIFGTHSRYDSVAYSTELVFCCMLSVAVEVKFNLSLVQKMRRNSTLGDIFISTNAGLVTLYETLHKQTTTSFQQELLGRRGNVVTRPLRS